MSEQEQPNETTQPVSEDLTQRVNSGYVANGYTLLNGGSDNVVMVKGDKDDKSVDLLMTLEGMEEVVSILRSEISQLPK